MSRGQYVDLRLGQQLFERQDCAIASSLDRLLPIVLVDQKILQGRQQKRAESPLFSISAFQCIFLEQIKKKGLHEVLCISGSIAAVTQKGIKWRPVSFAKSGKCAMSRFR